MLCGSEIFNVVSVTIQIKVTRLYSSVVNSVNFIFFGLNLVFFFFNLLVFNKFRLLLSSSSLWLLLTIVQRRAVFKCQCNKTKTKPITYQLDYWAHLNHCNLNKTKTKVIAWLLSILWKLLLYYLSSHKDSVSKAFIMIFFISATADWFVSITKLQNSLLREPNWTYFFTAWT